MTTAKAAQSLHADSTRVLYYTNHGLVEKRGSGKRLKLKSTWITLPTGRRIRDYKSQDVAAFKQERKRLGI